MAPGQEADGDNLGKSFLSVYTKGTLSVLIRIASMMMPLMSTLNIQ